MGWVDGAVVGFDTETTGLDVATDRIVSAAVVRRHGTTTRVTSWVVDPGVAVPAGATAVHGLTTEHVRRHGRPPVEALDEVADVIAGALLRGEPLVAFNASFDLSILEAELARLALPGLAARLRREVRVVLDPLVLDRALDRTRPGRRRLGDLLEHYCGGRAARVHCADADVRATLGVLDGLVRRYPHLATADLDDLHDHQARTHRLWCDERNARLAAAAACPVGRGDRPSRAEPGWPLRISARPPAA